MRGAQLSGFSHDSVIIKKLTLCSNEIMANKRLIGEGSYIK